MAKYRTCKSDGRRPLCRKYEEYDTVVDILIGDRSQILGLNEARVFKLSHKVFDFKM